MRKLIIILNILLMTGTAAAREVRIDKFPYNFGVYEINAGIVLPEVWVFEREMSLSDAKAVAFRLNAPLYTKAYLEITYLSSNLNTKNRRKIIQKRRAQYIRSAKSKSWVPDLVTSDGRIKKELSIISRDAAEEGFAFIFPDACRKKPKYLVRIIVDFSAALRISDNPVVIEITQTAAPSAQATLFKYPSEKNPSQAVILMKTSGRGPEYIHFTKAVNGKPLDLFTLPVEDYFFSASGLFTRLYINGSYLDGSRVSMHHISADFASIYSVCVQLQKKRQELEGYH